MNGGVGLGARRVAPVRIRVVVVEIIGHRVHHATWYLRSSGTVEVRDWMAVVNALESRKLRADLREQRCSCGRWPVASVAVMTFSRSRRPPIPPTPSRSPHDPPLHQVRGALHAGAQTRAAEAAMARR